MSGVIFRSVLAFAEWHYRERLYDLGACRTRARKMGSDVGDRDVHVLVRFVDVRCEWTAGLSEHDCAFCYRKLCMCDCSIAPGRSQTLLESEAVAEPIDSGRYVVINEDRNYSGCRC